MKFLAKTLSQILISALTARSHISVMLGSTAGASSEAYQSIASLTYLGLEAIRNLSFIKVV